MLQKKIFIILLLVSTTSLAQIQEPKEPIPPNAPTNININKNGQAKIIGYPLTGTVVFADNSTNIGKLYFAYDHITFYFTKNKKKYKNTQSITNIKSIVFSRWKSFKQKDSASLFFPVSTHIQLKNNLSFTCDYFIKDFEKFIFVTAVGQTKIYSIFYDYWEKGKWQNSKSSSKKFPTTHALGTCITKIIFEE